MRKTSRNLVKELDCQLSTKEANGATIRRAVWITSKVKICRFKLRMKRPYNLLINAITNSLIIFRRCLTFVLLNYLCYSTLNQDDVWKKEKILLLSRNAYIF